MDNTEVAALKGCAAREAVGDAADLALNVRELVVVVAVGHGLELGAEAATAVVCSQVLGTIDAEVGA